MTVAPTLHKYLAAQGIEYDTLKHEDTVSASRSAEASHVSGDRVAKAVVMRDDDGYFVAVLPASRRIALGELWRWFHHPVGLATEDEVAGLFADCARGAVPAIGAAYGLRVVVDDSLLHQGYVYFEGGDHASLVRVAGEHFDKLMAGAQHHRFTRHL